MTTHPLETAKADTISFLHDLAHLPYRHGVLRSEWAPHSRSYKFRYRLYRFRASALRLLCDAETREAAQAWLGQVLGPRATKDWLDLTIFRLEKGENNTARIAASIEPVLYGPDLVFEDSEEYQAQLAAARALLSRASGARGAT